MTLNILNMLMRVTICFICDILYHEQKSEFEVQHKHQMGYIIIFEMDILILLLDDPVNNILPNEVSKLKIVEGTGNASMI